MTSYKWRDHEKEIIIDPNLPIIDTHHHIWMDPPAPIFDAYTPSDLTADVAESGHNIVATVLVDSHSNHRTSGPEALRPVGETELADEVASDAQARGGRGAGICSVILPYADLCLGAEVGEVLDAHAAASKRFRGIRYMLAHDPKLPPMYGGKEAGISRKPEFRAGFAELARRHLIFEAWVLHVQHEELLDLARSFPEVTIAIDHMGGPMRIGPYVGKEKEVFEDWKTSMAKLATCPNVFVKLGGGYPAVTAFVDMRYPESPLASQLHAEINRDYVLAAIDIFSPSRCMFESNFPFDMMWTSYDNIWNSFKRITANFSEAERHELFADVARRVYRIQ